MKTGVRPSPSVEAGLLIAKQGQPALPLVRAGIGEGARRVADDAVGTLDAHGVGALVVR